MVRPVLKRLMLPVLLAAGLLATGFAPYQDFDQDKAAPKDGEKVVVLDTSEGQIVVMLFPEIAPIHAANFLELAGEKFYDGVRFHRCIEGFMIQGGDPNSKDLSLSGIWGTGDHKDKLGRITTLPHEFGKKLLHKRGVLSMARSQNPDSASCQFFIMQADSDFLDGQYSAFGKVVTGLDVVDKIVKTGDKAQNGKVEPKAAVVIKSATVATWPLKTEVSR